MIASPIMTALHRTLILRRCVSRSPTWRAVTSPQRSPVQARKSTRVPQGPMLLASSCTWAWDRETRAFPTFRGRFTPRAEFERIRRSRTATSRIDARTPNERSTGVAPPFCSLTHARTSVNLTSDTFTFVHRGDTCSGHAISRGLVAQRHGHRNGCPLRNRRCRS